MVSDKTPDQWEAADIIEQLKRDRDEMARRRKEPRPGVCAEHALLLESAEHDKTASIWIVRRLDLEGERSASGVSGKTVAAIVTGILALAEGVRALLHGGAQ